MIIQNVSVRISYSTKNISWSTKYEQKHFVLSSICRLIFYYLISHELYDS